MSALSISESQRLRVSCIDPSWKGWQWQEAAGLYTMARSSLGSHMGSSAASETGVECLLVKMPTL